MKRSIVWSLAAVTAFGLNSVAPHAYSDETAPAAAQTASLEAGAPAPDFALPDQNNKVHRLGDYKGKMVVLAFYPADMTGGCTLEAHSLTAALNDFDKRGVKVLGISVQGVESKKKFCELEGITYPLLADTEKQISRAYGVLSAGGVSNRVSFVIAPDGKIAAVDRAVNVRSHAQDLLALIDKMKPAAPATASIDQPVAPFSLPDAAGKDVAVANWGAYKATVVMFISTNCPVSNGYNARMRALARDYAPKGVRLIGINANDGEAPSDIAAHSKKQGFSFAVLKDAGNVVADRFAAKVTPETYVIDSKGVLCYHGRIDDSMEGQPKQNDLRLALNALVAGRAVTAKEVPAFGCQIKRAEK